MKRLETAVGALVVMSAAIVCAAVYAIGNARFIGARVPYHTYLRDAGGIGPNTAVLFGGITVGKVTRVAPDAADPTRIQIDFDVTPGTPLNAKSVAKLGSTNMLADPVISITTGANDVPQLPPGAAIPSIETVSLDDLQRKLVALADSAQTVVVSMGADLSHIMADARPVLANLNDVTGVVNRRHVASMLANADAIIAHLPPKLDRISDEVLKLTNHADATFSNADGTITALREPIQADLGELKAAIGQARTLIGSMQAVVRANSDAIHATLENLRMATDNLRDVTDSVKERPWSLIRIKQPKDRKVPE